MKTLFENTEIDSLVLRLTEAEDAYYNSDPIMEDAQYDILRDRLGSLDPSHPHLSKVGADLPSAGLMLEKRPHSIPMGSQRKAMDESEFINWVNSSSKSLGILADELVVQLSYKMDGGSFSFEFKNGEFVECLSRGDGVTGEVVTGNAVHFKGIPSPLIDPRNAKPFSGVVRAEVVMHEDDWKAVDSDANSNPRNIGNGIARRKSGGDAHLLQVVAFRAFDRDGEICDKEDGMSAMLSNMGFMVAPSITGTYQQAWQFFSEVDDNRRSGQLAYPYWIDGAVVKINDISLQSELGVADGRPKGQVALKFAAQGFPSALEGVILTVGHTGLISPTGSFKPVVIGGTTVSSALLVNWNNIAKLDIAVGDSVLLHKSGEIIPRVLSVTERPLNRITIEQPTSCPVCSGEVGKKVNVDGEDSAHLFCLNSNCTAQTTGKIERFIKSLNILGVGDEVLKSLVSTGLISQVSDLYLLSDKAQALANLSMGSSGVRFGEKRAERLISEVEKMRELTIPELIGSLGISNLGKGRVELIMTAAGGKMDTVDSWLDGSLLDCAEEAGVPKLAAVITCDIANYAGMIASLFENGVTIKKIEIKEVAVGAKSFCATGSLSISKKELERRVADSGNVWKSSVSKGLDYLIMADPTSTSSKAKKARSMGVSCISEDDFLTLITQ